MGGNGNYAAGAGTEWRALGAARDLRMAGCPLRHDRLGPISNRPTLQGRARKLPQCHAADSAASMVEPAPARSRICRQVAGMVRNSGNGSGDTTSGLPLPVPWLAIAWGFSPRITHAPRRPRCIQPQWDGREGQRVGKPRTPWSRCLLVRR